MRKGLSYLAYGVAAGVVLVGASHDALRAAGASANDKLALFAEVFNKVRDNYAEKPDDEKMIKSAIDGMLASLDPHSNYFDPKALQDFQSSMKGEEFGGLGLEGMMENGLVKVVSPMNDTPAAGAGMVAAEVLTRTTAHPRVRAGWCPATWSPASTTRRSRACHLRKRSKRCAAPPSRR